MGAVVRALALEPYSLSRRHSFSLSMSLSQILDAFSALHPDTDGTTKLREFLDQLNINTLEKLGTQAFRTNVTGSSSSPRRESYGNRLR